jgi:hypothetical protein
MKSITDFFSSFVKESASITSESKENSQNKEDCFVKIPDEVLLQVMHALTLSSVTNFTTTCKKYNIMSEHEKFPYCVKLAQSIFKNIHRLPTYCAYANYFGKIDSSKNAHLSTIDPMLLINKYLGIDNNYLGIEDDTLLGSHDFHLNRKLVDITAENKSKFFSFFNNIRTFKVLSVKLEEINENMSSKNRASLDLAVSELNATYAS